MSIIGVLAVQGDFLEHRQALGRLGATSTEVRLPSQLDAINGLIIPGGESTTIVHLIDTYWLRDALRSKILAGMPVWGTCAGMIVLANRLVDSRPKTLNLMDIEVSRNGFGRQVDSFEADLEIDRIEGPPFRAVFIRAPTVESVGKDVKIMATLPNGRPVAVQQDHMIATSFHPELAEDDRIHRLFLSIVKEYC